MNTLHTGTRDPESEGSKPPLSIEFLQNIAAELFSRCFVVDYRGQEDFLLINVWTPCFPRYLFRRRYSVSRRLFGYQWRIDWQKRRGFYRSKLTIRPVTAVASWPSACEELNSLNPCVSEGRAS